MIYRKPMRKIIIYIMLATVVCLTVYCTAQTPAKYGKGLSETGLERCFGTIFTNPGEDCATMMNVSFVTPPGMKARVEVIGGGKKRYFDSEGGICTTFDSVNSVLHNGKSVVERHVFDKHNVVLNHLEPDTEYDYRILVDSAGTIVESDVHMFCTAGAEHWKAGIIGDFHHYSPLWSRLEHAMKMVDVLDSVADGMDFMLSTGDQSSWGGSFNFWTDMSMQPGFKEFMWASVQGNHDHETKDKVKSDAFFRDSHAFPPNGYAGQEGTAYWFRYGDVLFLMLNNYAMLSASSLPQVEEWMERVIEANPTKYRVVMQHIEWLIGTDGSSSQLNRFYKTFDRLGIDLAIAGNNHAYIRTVPLHNRQPVEPEEGTYYVVTPSSDNSRGRALKPVKANADIIAKRWSEGKNTVGGMLMDVDPERIVMTLYDRYGEVQDSFTVPAKR